MVNKKIYALIHVTEDDGNISESIIGVSFDFNTLKDVQTKIEPALISRETWYKLCDSAINNNYDSDVDNIILDIYTNVTKEYTIKQLERAEQVYDFFIKDYYEIKEIDYYEQKITKKKA